MKLPRWLRWRTREELDEEIAAHLDLETQSAIERGLTPEEARYAASRAIGNATRVKERAREADPLFHLENIAKDARYALRSLRRNPGFTAAAILSLALGIGVNSTIFSVADALLLQPLNVPHSGDLVHISATAPAHASDRLTYREYTAFRDQNRTLSGLMAQTFRNFAVQTGESGQARILFGDMVSGNYFSVLGIAPALGRSFLPEEDSSAAKDLVALLGHENWEINFHSDPNVVGQKIKLNSQAVTIIGVLPSRFRGTGDFMRQDFYLPLAAIDRLFPSGKPLADSSNDYLDVFGRLKSGVSLQAAQAEFAALPVFESPRKAVVLPIVASRMAADPDDLRLIILLLGIAAMVLLVGCVNVANLLLGRASSRAREMAIRQTVGASRGRLIAQLLTESLVLAALGASAGLLLSWWAIQYFASIQFSPDLASIFPARLDGRVLAYALLATDAAVISSSLWPAIRATRLDLISPARRAPEYGGVGCLQGRNALVTIQTALATMLLVAASLFVKSFLFARHENPGFRVENVLVMSFDPTLAGVPDGRARTFYRQVQERVRSLPGVRSAALANHTPMGSGSYWNRVAPVGGAAEKTPVSVMFNRVGPDYFDTMAVPILKGRPIDEQDKPGGTGVVVVNGALARRFWPDGDAVGQRIRFGDWDGAPALEVVGIAGDGKYQEALDQFEPYLYVPVRQMNLVPLTLFVQTAIDPVRMASAVREAVKSIDPDMPVHDIHTMKEIFEQHGLLGARMMAQLVGAMGAIGLTLGVLGLYAVIAFVVTRKTREIGVRMALGATAASVLRQVLASGTKVTLVGIAIGLAGAFFLTRYAAEFLDRVNPRDPAVFAGVAVILLAAALVACWAPARRAARVDPAETLKYE